MIVITGPGRSGTSVLASIYKELGFDPGGGWNPRVRAGLEHGDFWRLNNKIAKELRITMVHPRTGAGEQAGSGGPDREPTEGTKGPTRDQSLGSRAVRAARRVMARGTSASTREATSRGEVDAPAGTPVRHRPHLAEWDRFDRVVARHAETMRTLAAETAVVKDPRFIFTLPAWAAAGAHIEHVLITMRPLGAVASSRRAARLSEFGPAELRNIMTYGVGMALATVLEHRLPYSFLMFPEFLQDPDALYESLVFPGSVSREQFRGACERTIDLDQVHEWSGDRSADDATGPQMTTFSR